MSKEPFSSKKYEESYEPANKWLQKNAPDFVTECVDELVDYVEYLKNLVEDRDRFIKEICEAHGVDASNVFDEGSSPDNGHS